MFIVLKVAMLFLRTEHVPLLRNGPIRRVAFYLYDDIETGTSILATSFV